MANYSQGKSAQPGASIFPPSSIQKIRTQLAEHQWLQIPAPQPQAEKRHSGHIMQFATIERGGPLLKNLEYRLRGNFLLHDFTKLPRRALYLLR
jgi:hypothetical protein